LGQEGLFHGAVLVAHQGEVVLVQGYGLADRERETPITPQSRFRIASMTKQFTAMAILILQSQDKLDVFDLICNYIDDCPAAWKDITIHHLLTHTSGFPRDLSSSEWRSILATNDPSEQTMARFKDLHLAIPPGEEWYYSNIGYIILGSIIEQTSGQSYETFLQESIFSPLNMRNTGYQHSAKDVVFGYSYQLTKLPVDFDDTSGIINAAGGLYSTVEDLYLWDQVLYTEQLLPQAQLDQMFAPHKQTPDSDGWAYGYGWVIGEERGRTLVVHNGESEGFRSLIARYPDEHITIILLSNQGTTDVEFYPETISKKIFGES
jgi:CubicO group peptidase (beta-lactamase class C family)